MISGYFDDSGKESNATSSFVTMAGYLADDTLWLGFTRLWQHQLLRHGISAVHMRDAIPIRGEYEQLGWDKTIRDAVLADFIKLIKGVQLIGFGVGVDAEYWRQIRHRLPKDSASSVQTFCFARVMKLITNRLKISRPRDMISVTFDTDREFAAARFNLFSDIWGNDLDARQYLASITFADPRVYTPLQAADVLAWETRKELIQKIGGHNSTARWNDLFTELSAIYAVRPDYDSELWDREAIDRDLLAKLPGVLPE